MEFKGVYTAILTPFSSDGKNIDYGAYKALVERQIQAGVTGIVPCGTTGESPTLTHKEHGELIEKTVEYVNGRIQVVPGTGSNSTAEAIKITQEACRAGVDAVMLVNPYYNKPSQEGFYRHFASIADAVDMPILVYNIPGRCGKNIENETMLKLAVHGNIAGVKEASGNIAQVMDLVMRKPPSFAIMSGDDNLTLPIITLGGSGVVSVASNYAPSPMLDLAREALDNNIEKARAIHYRLLPLFQAILSLDTNPIPIKYALARKGMLQEVYRLPMCSMTDDKKQIFDDILDKLDI